MPFALVFNREDYRIGHLPSEIERLCKKAWVNMNEENFEHFSASDVGGVILDSHDDRSIKLGESRILFCYAEGPIRGEVFKQKLLENLQKVFRGMGVEIILCPSGTWFEKPAHKLL